jgi:hypothetical protein
MRGLDRRLRVVEVRRFGSERVAQILRRIKAMSDQELIEQIRAEESGINTMGFDPQDPTDAELAFLIAEFRAGEAEEEADLASAQPNADPVITSSGTVKLTGSGLGGAGLVG